jgi:hypothetical protein
VGRLPLRDRRALDSRLRGANQGCAASADHSGTVLICKLLAIPAMLVVLAGIAAPAQANVEQQLAKYTPFAEAAWEQYYCGNPAYPGAPSITVKPHATADDRAELGRWGILAFADASANCTIWLEDATLTDVEACKLIVHEYGHLAGHGHTDDPTSIMNPRPVNVPYAPCDTGVPPARQVPSTVGSVKGAAPARKAQRRCKAGKRFMWARCR